MNEHCRTWSMATKLKNVEKETQTLYDLEYVEKHWNRCKMRNAHCRTWNRAKKTEIHENVKHKLEDLEYG